MENKLFNNRYCAPIWSHEFLSKKDIKTHLKSFIEMYNVYNILASVTLYRVLCVDRQTHIYTCICDERRPNRERRMRRHNRDRQQHITVHRYACRSVGSVGFRMARLTNVGVLHD